MELDRSMHGPNSIALRTVEENDPDGPGAPAAV